MRKGISAARLSIFLVSLKVKPQNAFSILHNFIGSNKWLTEEHTLSGGVSAFHPSHGNGICY